MRLKLERTHLEDTYTIGDLYIDGKYFCNVLEDKYKDLSKEKKVFGETSIPYGTYEIIITHSDRFKKDLPLLLNVPQFEGIRIHCGNTDSDTHGCLLVGVNDEVGKVTKSTLTFNKLLPIIQDGLKSGKIYIDIV
jgi:hypothetical protein